MLKRRRRRWGGQPTTVIFYFVGAETSVMSMLLLAQGQGIYGDPVTAAYCIAGSILGAFLSLALLPEAARGDSRHVVRNLSIKFGSAASCGFIGAPLIVEYFKINAVNYIIGVSGILSLVGISVLHVLIPEVPKIVTWLFRKKVADYTGVELDTEVRVEQNPPKPKPPITNEP